MTPPASRLTRFRGEPAGVEVAGIDTPALGDRSYLAHDGHVARPAR